MASSRERMFTASQVCRLLDEDSDVSSGIEIEVKTLNICVGCHDVYLFLQSDMPCHGVCCLTVPRLCTFCHFFCHCYSYSAMLGDDYM